MSNFTVTAQARTDLGKGASRRLRRLDDMVPAIVYGAGKDALSISVAHRQIVRHLEDEAFYSHILSIEIDGKKHPVVLKAVQRHPYKPRILHLDFQRVDQNEKLIMHVPLHFMGEDKAPGIILQKGVITHLVNEIEVRCKPSDLPEYIEVNVSHLKADETVHLSDITLPKGVESMDTLHGKDLALANIQLPRGEVEAAAATE